jgi:hypothetical protein
MELKELFTLKSDYISRVVNDELVLVPLTGNIARMNEMFTLNDSARFIWENVQENMVMDGMIALMIAEYDIDSDLAERDILGFLEKIEMLILKK